MVPSLTWMRHPFGLFKAGKEREAAIQALTQHNEQLTTELEQTKADLVISNNRGSELEGIAEKLRVDARKKEEGWTRKSFELETLAEEARSALNIEQAVNYGVRDDLARKDLLFSRLRSVWEDEAYETPKKPTEAAISGTAITATTATVTPPVTPLKSIPSQIAKTTIGSLGLPYVSVIIDGDTHSYMFPMQHARDEKGGQIAASLILKDLTKYLNSQSDLPRHYELRVQIVLNISASKGTRGKHYPLSLTGFAKSNALFDVIDCGAGKEQADHKIRARLRLDMRNRDCCMVIFGGCHDAGYICVLSEYVADGMLRSKLRLILPQNCYLQFKDLGLKWVEFPSVFPACGYARIAENGMLIQTGGLPLTRPVKGRR